MSNLTSKERFDQLHDMLHTDQSGLVAGLEAVLRVVAGFRWATESRGCYEWDDDRFHGEMKNMLDAVQKDAQTALDRWRNWKRPCCNSSSTAHEPPDVLRGALLGLVNHKGQYRDGSATDLWAAAYEALEVPPTIGYPRDGIACQHNNGFWMIGNTRACNECNQEVRAAPPPPVGPYKIGDQVKLRRGYDIREVLEIFTSYRVTAKNDNGYIDLPAWQLQPALTKEPALTIDDPPKCHCDRCGRKTWEDRMAGKPCGMRQPAGGYCGGTMTAQGEPRE